MTTPATPFRPEYGLIDGLVIHTSNFSFPASRAKIPDLIRLLDTYGDPTGKQPLEHLEYHIATGEPQPIASISATGMRQVLDGLLENIVDCIYEED